MSARDGVIVAALANPSLTLQEIGKQFGITRQRVQQIAAKAGIGRPRLPLAESFWSRVDKNGPVPEHMPHLGQCWGWMGQLYESGYGRIKVGGKYRRAHRVAWFLETGEYPEHNANHHCDNPSCVRFSHLFDGSQADNMRDAAGKDRVASKLTSIQADEIRTRYATGDVTQPKLAVEYGVSSITVLRIVNNQTWRQNKSPEPQALAA